MDYFTVKNWDKFQHYKDRLPPWIKLHRELLNNYEFTCLQDASKLHLMLIWLLASQTDNKLPADPAWLKNALHIDTEPDLEALFNAGFIEIDSDLLAACKQVDIVETETEAYKQETDKKKKGVKRFTPPSLDEIQSYITEKNYSVIAERFLNHYESNGWMVGKTKMKDWKAAVRNWHSRNKENQHEKDQRPSRAAKSVSKLDEIARADIEANGFASTLDN